MGITVTASINNFIKIITIKWSLKIEFYRLKKVQISANFGLGGTLGICSRIV